MEGPHVGCRLNFVTLILDLCRPVVGIFFFLIFSSLVGNFFSRFVGSQ